jgi:hypothetical protein
MAARLAESLPYLHPIWQIAALILMGIGLSIGLVLRRERELPWDPAVRAALVRRHLAVTATFLGMLTAGHVMGLVTMAYVRHRPLFRSAHAYFGTIALGLFWLGAAYGVKLARGGPLTPRDYSNHAFCVILGALLALAVAVMGYGLLP